jgi:hypothetical protein
MRKNGPRSEHRSTALCARSRFESVSCPCPETGHDTCTATIFSNYTCVLTSDRDLDEEQRCNNTLRSRIACPGVTQLRHSVTSCGADSKRRPKQVEPALQSATGKPLPPKTKPIKLSSRRSTPKNEKTYEAAKGRGARLLYGDLHLPYCFRCVWLHAYVKLQGGMKILQ